MATRFSRFFGTSAEFWCTLQIAYDLSLVAASKEDALSRIIPHKQSGETAKCSEGGEIYEAQSAQGVLFHLSLLFLVKRRLLTHTLTQKLSIYAEHTAYHSEGATGENP